MRRGERADLGAIGGGQRRAVRALDEHDHRAGALLLAEGVLAVLGGLRGLRALGQEPRGVVGDDLVAEQGSREGQPDRDGQPHGDDALRVAGGEADDDGEHLGASPSVGESGGGTVDRPPTPARQLWERA